MYIKIQQSRPLLRPRRRFLSSGLISKGCILLKKVNIYTQELKTILRSSLEYPSLVRELRLKGPGGVRKSDHSRSRARKIKNPTMYFWNTVIPEALLISLAGINQLRSLKREERSCNMSLISRSSQGCIGWFWDLRGVTFNHPQVFSRMLLLEEILEGSHVNFALEHRF